ncbi:hypothetical protein G4E03_003463 [Salmonella enterica]|nr:hypothetical protein [Salmonella enterica]
MMLPNELIQNETEFKHACSYNGREAIRLLRWIQSQKKEQVFTTKNAEKIKEIIWFVENIESLINDIESENQALAPEMSL